MIIEIDAGNTFLKWRVLESGQIIDRGMHRVTDLCLSAVKVDVADKIAISSVAGSVVNECIAEQCKRRWQLAPHWAVTQDRQAGLTNSYDDPSRMGVDRWMVMLAAYAECRSACCIVDCGSAITVDYVSADGMHEGGYIIPGLNLMRQSLLKNTAEVWVDQEISEFSVTPGVSTSEAVQHGVNRLFKSLQQSIVAELKDGYELYVTGGDGELFHYLAGKGKYRPDLVMDGLAVSLGY